jgi:hypothetical protein
MLLAGDPKLISHYLNGSLAKHAMNFKLAFAIIFSPPHKAAATPVVESEVKDKIGQSDSLRAWNSM